jgi:hypothetical protein
VRNVEGFPTPDRQDVLIHPFLHALGLGENPHTSKAGQNCIGEK